MEKPGKKVCMKCGEEKPVAEFHLCKTLKDGLRASCKSCVAKYFRRYREENKEKVAAEKRRYCEENKEKVAAVQRRYYEKNKEKVAAKKRRYNEENKEKIAASHRRYKEALPDAYVKQILDPLRCTHIPQPLIEAKRFHLRIVRELRKD